MNPILEELEAQLESHGVGALEFRVEGTAFSPEMVLVVDDVMFQDDKIKVKLAPDQF